jgi:hypothetical protein
MSVISGHELKLCQEKSVLPFAVPAKVKLKLPNFFLTEREVCIEKYRTEVRDVFFVQTEPVG